MKLYLAGPMTGYEGLNFPAFNAETERLRALGYEVVSPAEINPDTAAEWRACMRADIRELVLCDGVAMLPGWECSRGATLERHIAMALELAVFIASELVSPQVEGLARCA